MWRARRRQKEVDAAAETTFRYLKILHLAMQHRIDNGDLDFDDTVYRTRDACATLISIRDPEWRP